MWPDEIDALARKGQQQDMLRRAEQGQLIRRVSSQPVEGDGQRNQDLFRKGVGRLGHWLIKWGLKMQNYSLASPSK